MKIRSLLLVMILMLSAATVVHGDSNSKLLDRPWRGMNCLYCLHDRASGGSAPITSLLRETRLKRVMISFVVDGSFGWKAGEIERAVKYLRDGGQEVWLHLYVYNGPAQRRWSSGIFQSFAVMDPNIFRSRLVNDKRLQAQFLTIVKERVLPAALYAKSLGAKVTIAPGLEDNLDDQGFRTALYLVRKGLGKKVTPTYVRSGCFRCGVGNGRALPVGTLLEEHDDQLFSRRWDGIINSDGRYFRFSNENTTDPTLDEIGGTWLDLATRQRDAFLLWVPHFQDTPKGMIPKPLSERNFRGPTDAEKDELVRFLSR